MRSSAFHNSLKICRCRWWQVRNKVEVQESEDGEGERRAEKERERETGKEAIIKFKMYSQVR